MNEGAPSRPSPRAPLIECRGLVREFRLGEQVIRPLENLDLDLAA